MPTRRAPVSPPPSLVRVRDGALPAPLFQRLARAVRGLGGRGLATTYRTTFWFGLGEPRALPEAAARLLAADGPLPGRPVVGVEWWLSRMRTSDVGVDFHLDRDEHRFARTGREVHPEWTTVLFLNRCRGGLLAVTAAAPVEAHPAKAPDLADADLVRPWPNRAARFPGGTTHGVLDANNRVPAGRLSPPTPLRLALVVNGWARRPEGVPVFDPARAGAYRALALDAPPRGARAGRAISRASRKRPSGSGTRAGRRAAKPSAE